MARVVAAGTKLKADFVGEGAASQLIGVESIGSLDGTADQIDLTELDPYEGEVIPANPEFFKTYTAGWRDGGQIVFNCNMDDATYQRLEQAWRRGENADFSLELRNGASFTFTGFITALGVAFDKMALVTTPVTIKLTGKATYVPPS